MSWINLLRLEEKELWKTYFFSCDSFDFIRNERLFDLPQWTKKIWWYSRSKLQIQTPLIQTHKKINCYFNNFKNLIKKCVRVFIFRATQRRSPIDRVFVNGIKWNVSHEKSSSSINLKWFVQFVCLIYGGLA